MITILRLGERPGRDQRINTHLALVSRAFGADKLIMFFKDQSLLDSIASVNRNFGGDFSLDVRQSGEWRAVIKQWKGFIAHLTMYGQDLDSGLTKLHSLVSSQEETTSELKSLEAELSTDEVGEQRGRGNDGPGKQPIETNDLLVIVGGEKVPAEVYSRAHVNIAVGNQPHSEVAALAVFLDRFQHGRWAEKEMPGWKHKIIPQDRGKKVQSSDE